MNKKTLFPSAQANQVGTDHSLHVVMGCRQTRQPARQPSQRIESVVISISISSRQAKKREKTNSTNGRNKSNRQLPKMLSPKGSSKCSRPPPPSGCRSQSWTYCGGSCPCVSRHSQKVGFILDEWCATYVFPSIFCCRACESTGRPAAFFLLTEECGRRGGH